MPENQISLKRKPHELFLGNESPLRGNLLEEDELIEYDSDDSDYVHVMKEFPDI